MTEPTSTMAGQLPQARGQIFFGWWALCAAFVGQIFGASNMLLFSLGVFTRPLQAEFGWTRAQLAAAGTMILWGMVVLSPFQGYLVDRFGTRRVNLTTLPFFAVGLGSLYFLPANIVVFYGAWLVITLFGIVLWSGPYNKVVAAWFDRRLGLALGITNAGQGLGIALIPLFAQLLVSHLGWRFAYVGLGLILVIPFLVNLIFLRERPTIKSLAAEGKIGKVDNEEASASSEVGFTVREATRRRAFWLLLAAFVLIGLMAGFVTTGQVPMLIDRGITPAKAALVASVFGIGVISGRLLVGWLVDFIFAPYVMMGSMACSVIGLLMFATGDTGDTVFLWAILIGLGVGAENDLLGFCIARYFGRKAYGKLYGLYISSFQLGAGVSAVGLGVLRTAYGSYVPGVLALAMGITLVIVLSTRLGPYVYGVERR